MLKVFLGEMPEAVYYPPVYFDNTYEDDWIMDPLSKEMIQDVDKSVVVGPRLIDSPVLGPIPVKDLSGGVKTLMLLAFDKSERVFNISACGDNCAKWILKIGQVKDITVNLRHLMDFGKDEFDFLVLNTGEHVHNMREFVDIAGDFV